ncbi:IS66 family insertion sequence element accessory protein TnpB [Paraburkholderia youngii]|uniref:IS66 family insertion sequence element accessory protein TnpB n=1 Tax=Paraburkholderia youngii TaxID=2782701 RepID=UPI003D1AAA2E
MAPQTAHISGRTVSGSCREGASGTRRESARRRRVHFRGRRGDLVKILWATDDGLWLLAKRISHGRFVWP